MVRMRIATFNHIVHNLRERGCFKIPSTPISRSKWYCSSCRDS
jgi:hypothetical protein